MNNQYYNMYPNFNSVPGMRSINPIYQAPMARGGLLSSLIGGSRAGAVGSAAAVKSFSWSGLLNGASKTLGVINQAIPVVYQIKPIWNNAKTIFKVAREMNSSDKSSTNTTSNVNNGASSNSSNSTNTNINNNTPNFFI